jgi:hypothetical protein
VVLKAFRALFGWRFNSLAASAEKMRAVSAGALRCLFCFSLFKSIFDSHRLAALHKRLSGDLLLPG